MYNAIDRFKLGIQWWNNDVYVVHFKSLFIFRRYGQLC